MLLADLVVNAAELELRRVEAKLPDLEAFSIGIEEMRKGFG